MATDEDILNGAFAGKLGDVLDTRSQPSQTGNVFQLRALSVDLVAFAQLKDKFEKEKDKRWLDVSTVIHAVKAADFSLKDEAKRAKQQQQQQQQTSDQPPPPPEPAVAAYAVPEGGALVRFLGAVFARTGRPVHRCGVEGSHPPCSTPGDVPRPLADCDQGPATRRGFQGNRRAQRDSGAGAHTSAGVTALLSPRRGKGARAEM